MAGGGGGGGNSRELHRTPTWAVAAVCAVIILISILLEKGLHRFGEWLTKKHKKALFDALDKVKVELMILGFISLLLTFGQSYIAKICIPNKVADTMLPCPIKADAGTAKAGGRHHRRLLTNALVDPNVKHRILAAGSIVSCPMGKVPLISTNGLHQLHIFIFFLAVFHVASSALTMFLGRAKMRRWKDWESETSSLEYEFSNDPSRFRFTHETSFVRQHTSIWNRITILFYFVCSQSRLLGIAPFPVKALILSHGFINAHLAPGSKFNFQKYIQRTLKDDFKVVAGISPVLWASAVIILLLNIHGETCSHSRNSCGATQRPSFWFGRPQFVLFLIHFALFQNAFQITYFFWIWYEFGLKYCFHDNLDFLVARVSIGVGVQFLSSYITLPLYALVSQISKALQKWHQAVKKKHEKGVSHASLVLGTSSRASSQASPVHAMHWSRTVGYMGATVTPSTIRHVLDQYNSDAEVEMLALSETNNQQSEPTQHQLQRGEQQNDEDEFSFAELSAQAGGKP